MPLHTTARERRAACCRWAAGVLCSLLWVAAVSAQPVATPPDADDAAADTTPESTPAAASPADAAARRAARAARPPVTPRFDIELQAPGELSGFLLRHLDIQRFRLQRTLDAAELERLLVELPANARNLLATRGHFDPRIEVGAVLPPTEEARQAAGTGPAPLGRIPVRVDPGEQTRVEAVQVIFQGAIANAPEAALQRDEIQREAALLAGQVFTQDDWDRTKTSALRRLTALRYPAGRIATSLADVDASQRSARLYIELDSGPVQRIGAVEVEGAQRYDPAITERIVRLAGLTPGSDYDLARLQQAQQRILDSGYFDAVFVYVEPTLQGGELPVKVQLREARRQRLVLGVGGSTDNGARISIEHTHNRVPGIDWRAQTTLRFERQDSLARTEWSSMPDRDGWRWVGSAQGARQEDGSLTTTSQRLRAGQSQDGLEYDRSIYLQYDRARAFNEVLNLPDNGRIESSITANYAWSRQRFDDPISPNRGHGLALEVGAGSTLGIDRKPFARTQARWQAFFPLGARDQTFTPVPGQPVSSSSASRAGRLALRLEGGAVIAGEDTPVPDTQLFLTGGDNTVRGYGLRDIGIAQADGSVRAGRYKAVVSLEWQRPVLGNGAARSPFEHVLFVDGGTVANRVRDLDFQWGVGTGLRYNSPVGPLQVDIAYGLETRRLRLHLNVGFVF